MNKLDIISILFSIIVSFAVIYFAVRLAISPLLYKSDEETAYDQDFGLVKLRDIDVLSPAELEEVINLFQNGDIRKESNKEYQKYEMVLKELKRINYLTDVQYSNKLDILKKYFNFY